MTTLSQSPNLRSAIAGSQSPTPPRLKLVINQKSPTSPVKSPTPAAQDSNLIPVASVSPRTPETVSKPTSVIPNDIPEEEPMDLDTNTPRSVEEVYASEEEVLEPTPEPESPAETPKIVRDLRNAMDEYKKTSVMYKGVTLPKRNQKIKADITLNEMGYYTVSAVNLNGDPAMNLIRVVSNNGSKFLILLDSDTYTTENMYAEHYHSAKAPNLDISELHRNSCYECENGVCATVYERDRAMCMIFPDGQKETVYVSKGGSPENIFDDDVTPFLVVKMSTLTNMTTDERRVFDSVVLRRNERTASDLLKKEIVKLDESISDAYEYYRSLLDYKALIVKYVKTLTNSINRLSSIKTEDLELKGKIWENLTHRRLLWGRLVSEIEDTCTADDGIKAFSKVLGDKKEMLRDEIKSMGTMIQFEYDDF